MFDFIKDIIVWFFKKILFFFFPLVGWVVWFFENYSTTWNNAWEWIFSSIKWYLQDFYLWLFSKITSRLSTFFSDHDFVVSVVEFSDSTFTAMNVFIPLNETCACVTLIVTTMIAVFLLRILLKSIPTFW